MEPLDRERQRHWRWNFTKGQAALSFDVGRTRLSSEDGGRVVGDLGTSKAYPARVPAKSQSSLSGDHPQRSINPMAVCEPFLTKVHAHLLQQWGSPPLVMMSLFVVVD